MNKKNELEMKMYFTKRWNAAEVTLYRDLNALSIWRDGEQKDMCMYNNEVYVREKKWRYLNTAKINDRFYVNYAFSLSGFHSESIKTCQALLLHSFPIALRKVIPRTVVFGEKCVSH